MSAVRLGLRRFALRPFETGLAKTGFGWNRFWLKPVFVETGFDCRETGFELKPVLIETGFGMAVRQSKRSPKSNLSAKNGCSSVKTFAKISFFLKKRLFVS